MQVISQQGDTVDQICHRHLGSTAGVTEQVLAINPALAAHGPVLPPGVPVHLPDAIPAIARRPVVQLWD